MSGTVGFSFDEGGVYLKKALSSARSRARKNGWEFNLTTFDLDQLWEQQAGRCAVSGILFDGERYEHALVKMPFAPSLDRINAREGYVRGNVRFVCTAANFGMGQWGEEVLRTIAEGMTRPKRSEEGEAMWFSEKRNRLRQLEEEAKELSGQALQHLNRRIAGVKAVITKGPIRRSRKRRTARSQR